ncbi:MAG: type II toxin-antitoxin system RelE/ParE family toxin [Gemmatimonadota bacterium]|nr:type II toxin-antitoxin system RelE/ParE family toxin [Gemmatimonadota bacterium]MDH3422266.1 type II toxin-antitoxin system RelE/ParE family toxin [Gemmatimonadota bacterium]
MSAEEPYVEFITTRMFEASAKKLLAEEDRRELELLLLDDPRRGQVIERTGGFRKVRFARPSRKEGKSGGTRVIYYFIQRKDRIYLIEVYAKGVKDNLTRAEENGLREAARVLEGEK